MKRLLWFLLVPIGLGAMLSPPATRLVVPLIAGAQENLDRALFQAAAQGEAGRVRALLARGANPNRAHWQRKTVWHVAAEAEPGRSEALLKSLAGYPPDWNTPDERGLTAFALLCETRLNAWAVPFAVRLRRALDEGANPGVMLAGKTPLIVGAAAMGSPQSHVVQLLLVRGARVDARDAAGFTALHRACEAYGEWACEGGGENSCDAKASKGRRLIEALLQAGADSQARTRGGKLAIQLVLESAYRRDVAPLFSRNARKSGIGAAQN